MYVYYADTLTKDDLRTLTNAVIDVVDVWYQFGVQLEVPVAQLNTIRTTFPNPVDCLSNMLSVWLSITTPSPTWQTVVDALCSPAVGRQGVAENIKLTYCKQDTGTCVCTKALYHRWGKFRR